MNSEFIPDIPEIAKMRECGALKSTQGKQRKELLGTQHMKREAYFIWLTTRIIRSNDLVT